MKIIKKYSCDNCTHKNVCLYQENMIKIWKDLERQYIVDSNIIFDDKKLLFPYAAFLGLECKFFRKD